MITYNNPKEVISILSKLKGANYRLLYHLGEIPNSIPEKKDIDIIVQQESFPLLASFLEDFCEIVHPNYHEPHLYNLIKRRMFVKDGLYIDIHQQLAVRSLNHGEWIPLDQELQSRVWARSSILPNLDLPILAPTDEFVYLTARAIFDKKTFSKSYSVRLKKLFYETNPEETIYLLEKILFRFSSIAYGMIKLEQFDQIYHAYRTFKDY
jgi:hypothetical protein